jgi:lipoteichoic acid synthase
LRESSILPDRSRQSTRGEWLLIAAPFLVLMLIVWAKLSYFNFPPREHLATEWVKWNLKEAVQAWASTAAILLVLCSPLLLLRPVSRFVALAIVDLLVTVLVLSNLLYFRFYGDVISVTVITVAGQVGGVTDSLVRLVRPTDILLVADLLLIPIALPLYARAIRRRGLQRARPLRRYVGKAILAGVLLLLVAPVRIVVLDRGETFRYNYVRLFGVRKIGLLDYHLYESWKRYGTELFARVRVTPEERKEALGYVATVRRDATAPSPLFGAARGRNVIFLMVESLQGFPIGLRVEGQEVTPVLNQLAARSLYFKNFYGQTWEGTTSDGEFTSLQSLHPLTAGSVATTYPTHQYRGVPAILKERGYATMSAHAYYGSLWNMQIMHPRLGFQKSYFHDSYKPGEEIGMGLSDAEFFRQTAPRIERLPQPFMAYVMTLTSHHPFEMPAKYRTLKLGVMQGTMLGDYLQAVHYTDASIGALIAELKRAGLWDNTVLALYGDHKADLGDAKDMERLLTTYAGYPPRQPGFDARYWRVQNGVTFMVHLPGDAHAGVHTVSGGHLDIAPTVLNLLGIANHTMITLGKDLTQDRDRLVVLRSGSFVLADTACVTPSPEFARNECGVVSTGAKLDAAHFDPRYAEARKRLQVSDLILTGDLIPPR